MSRRIEAARFDVLIGGPIKFRVESSAGIERSYVRFIDCRHSGSERSWPALGEPMDQVMQQWVKLTPGDVRVLLQIGLRIEKPLFPKQAAPLPGSPRRGHDAPPARLREQDRRDLAQPRNSLLPPFACLLLLTQENR